MKTLTDTEKIALARELLDAWEAVLQDVENDVTENNCDNNQSDEQIR